MNATKCSVCKRLILLRGSLRSVTGPRAVMHKSCHKKGRV